MEQQSNKRPRRMVFQNLTAILTAIWSIGGKGFLFLWCKLLLDRLLRLYYPCAFQHRYLYLSLHHTSGNFSTQTKRRHCLLDQWCKLCETRDCFCFSYRYGPRQAYQITILHQNSWTEITISGGLDQNVPQSFASQMDRWGRHLLAVVHEIKQLNLTYRRVNTELLIHQTRK